MGTEEIKLKCQYKSVRVRFKKSDESATTIKSAPHKKTSVVTIGIKWQCFVFKITHKSLQTLKNKTQINKGNWCEIVLEK